MRISTLSQILVTCLVPIALACGGGQSKPSDPSAEKAGGPSAEPAASSQSASSADDAKKADDKAEESASVVPKRTPKDIITAPDVVFIYSFGSSDAKEKAEAACSEKTKGDAEKQAKCMEQARKKVDADGFHFRQGDDGRWWWLTMRNKGSAITWLHRIPIEFGEMTDTKITVKTTGKDIGTKPFARVPSQVTFEVPNEFQIEVNDPQQGKMVYEAKIGLLGEKDVK